METPLAIAFLSASGRELPEERRIALEERLGRALLAGRGAWPEVSLPGPTYARYLGERLDGEDAIAALDGACLEDLYLACGCVNDQPAAIAAFDKQVLGAVPHAVRRIDASAEFIDEVQQITRMKLLVADRSSAKITTYRGTGKLRSWVQVAAVRNAIELRKRAKPEQPFGDDELVDLGGWERDPELDHIKTLYRGEFVAAFQQALRELGSRDRNVLRMYLMDGLNIDQIGAVYRVHRATVARWIAKSREKLLVDTRRLLLQRLQITGTDFESLMAVVRSHLDLSIERFLEASG